MPVRGSPLTLETGPSSPQISVPGNLCSAVLPGLGRNAEYDITILAYYRDGAQSDPVSLCYTPCAPSSVWGASATRDLCTVSQSPPSNLALASETPNTLKVSWTPPHGHVLHYRLTYALASSSGPETSISVPGPRSHVTLPDLLAATKYRVLVSAVYGAGESMTVSATGQTGECARTVQAFARLRAFLLCLSDAEPAGGKLSHKGCKSGQVPGVGRV
ncbi:collagen alpha-1(XX) chain-like [Elephas maximus indicus]|uniref:collagen alpha-1(XX) chain-like n=1 Tax=Elephas maximus indicus TaxID=99487 RepID=UPI0021166499|nr:collagen alpha-1(XX) chain-like [Elephas maximus indicus]